MATLALGNGHALAQDFSLRSFWQDDPNVRWLVETSVATRHFQPDPAHVNTQRLINLERVGANGRLLGFASFRNSFGQPSAIAYFGQRWYPIEQFPEFHVKLAAGLMHGYRGEYKDKIPFNQYGIAPVIVPAIGVSYRRVASELVLFGNSGVMLTLGYYVY